MRPRHFIMLALLVGAWTAVPAIGGYLVDSSGAVVRNAYGECWHTGSWTPAQAIAECEPDLVKKEAAAAPEAAPLPGGTAGFSNAFSNIVGEEKAKGGAIGGGVLGFFGSTLLSTAVNMREHHWAPILQKGREAKELPGFGMYTYVLFGRKPAATGDEAMRARYDATLSAVLRSLPELRNPSSAQDRGATNLFCLPATSWVKLDLKSYNFPMAQDYLKEFRFLLAGDTDILPRLRDGIPGPFLIATLQPLGSIVKMEGGQRKIADADAPILFIDMTSTHHEVIAEMVDAFKLKVLDTTLDRRERFHPLRVALIDVLKKADDKVTPIKEAVAAFLPPPKKDDK